MKSYKQYKEECLPCWNEVRSRVEVAYQFNHLDSSELKNAALDAITSYLIFQLDVPERETPQRAVERYLDCYYEQSDAVDQTNDCKYWSFDDSCWVFHPDTMSDQTLESRADWKCCLTLMDMGAFDEKGMFIDEEKSWAEYASLRASQRRLVGEGREDSIDLLWDRIGKENCGERGYVI